MRARTAVLPLVALLALGSAAPTSAHHDCGNEKSQDDKEREECEKERERREKADEDDDGKRKKAKGKRAERREPPPPPREEWAERTAARTELRISASAELVAQWVPDRYQVVTTSGKATVLVTARTFAAADGSAAVLHEASVVVTAPDASAGVHSYLLWQVTDATWLTDKLYRVGLPVHQVNAPYTTTSASLVARVRGEVSLGDVDYTFEGSVRESAGASTGTPTVIWYDGFLGTVRASTTCSPCGAPGQGVMVVSAAAGSRVSAYLSAEAAITPGSFVRFDGATVAAVVR